jgi:serine/threonine-protein kinase RsbW
VTESPAANGITSIADPDSHANVTKATPALAGTAVSLRTWSRSFRATADQVREARRFLAGAMGDSPVVADAIACVSELATNSILHSNSRRPGGHFTVHMCQSSEVLRVEVQDEGGPWEPQLDQDEQNGRGLAIVGELSRDWGVFIDETESRIVWFELNYP